MTTSSPLDCYVHLDIEGAAPDELSRAERAVAAMFEACGVRPYEAALAAFNQEALDDGMTHDAEGAAIMALTPEQFRLAALWRTVETVAEAACCKGWDRPAGPVHYQLLRPDGTPLTESIEPRPAR